MRREGCLVHGSSDFRQWLVAFASGLAVNQDATPGSKWWSLSAHHMATGESCRLKPRTGPHLLKAPLPPGSTTLKTTSSTHGPLGYIPDQTTAGQRTKGYYSRPAIAGTAVGQLPRTGDCSLTRWSPTEASISRKLQEANRQ